MVMLECNLGHRQAPTRRSSIQDRLLLKFGELELKKCDLHDSRRLLRSKFVTFLLRIQPASRKANPHCMTKKYNKFFKLLK